MAVTASDQLLVHAMAERFREVSLRLGMAAIAQRWLLVGEERVLHCRVMGRVTGSAAHIRLHVGRTQEISVLLGEFVTLQTAPAYLVSALAFEGIYLRFIAAGVHVLRSRPMAGL